MTSKKTAPATKSTGKIAKKTAQATARRKAVPSSKAAPAAKKMAAATGADSTNDQEPAHGRAHDASDLARDQRLRKDLTYDSGRSPGDRHRERLTAVEAEEDGVRDDDDDGEPAADKREAVINEQDTDDDRA